MEEEGEEGFLASLASLARPASQLYLDLLVNNKMILMWARRVSMSPVLPV